MSTNVKPTAAGSSARRPAVAPALPAEPEDGRHARRERNRLAVVDAMLELYAEGNLEPSSDEIAERAGLSPRSLFRYFDDLDDLVRVAIARQHRRLHPLTALPVPADAPLPDRVGGLVQQRVRLFQAIASVGVVSRVRAPFQPLIAAELSLSRSFLRCQIEQLFAGELRALGKPGAAQAAAAIDVLTSFEAFQLFRHDQQQSVADVEATLVQSIHRLLEA
ncbi:MAG: TetR/AcrR family transcriptional regulator [Actinomycetota bacterium]|nr:TetR/AcrR family transcriptional regulator [Actinomycetota bacterium]